MGILGTDATTGLEDVTGYFADGLEASTRENTLSKQGVTTAIELRGDKPTNVNYIQGVARTFVSTSGKRVTTPVRHAFLKTGKL
jgi:hypothetical protein